VLLGQHSKRLEEALHLVATHPQQQQQQQAPMTQQQQPYALWRLDSSSRCQQAVAAH
jgi:hypothetical protein